MRRSHTAQDGRRAVLVRVRLNENERKLILDLTTTDSRRRALLEAAERKDNEDFKNQMVSS